jgi:N-acetylmuramoyl-L-alanine amidase
LKKIIFLIAIIIIIVGGYYYYNKIYLPSLIPTIESEKNQASITKYYIYGTHLNLEGNIKKINAKFKNVNLILWNTKTGKSKNYKINYSKNVNNVNFNISDEINNGIYLDEIKRGNYELYLKFTYTKDNKKTYKYYSLNNKTDYKTTTYYTLSKTNRQIKITKNDNSMLIKVQAKTNKEEVYDIVLDPSCGGSDTGAYGNGVYESTVTLEMAEKIKENLEKKKIKVKLTRTKDSLSETEYFDEYNQGGRAVIPQEVHAKYLLSLQATSNNNSKTNGISLYTAVGINYDFASSLIENITKTTNQQTSTNTYQRIDYGIYSHNFTESEINENMNYYEQKGYKKYNVTTNSNYIYMIRETGGIITGAYVDDSNPDKVGVNPYYKTNLGVESYVLTLGYLTNKDDIEAITTNKEKYAEAISNSIIQELKY